MLTIAAVVACAAAPAPTRTGTFDRAAWKADFERIKLGLAQGYANLDWQVDRRGFNLVRADQQIEAMLDKANSDVEAVVVLYRLVDALDDPHLRLLPGPPPESATLLPSQSSLASPTSAADMCSKADYSEGKTGTLLPYPLAPGWRELSPGPFLAGMIGDIGVIRIPAFGEERYLAACKTVAKPGLEGRELQLATRAELNRQLVALIASLRARGMKKLAIDVSGNGGGSEWSSEVAAMLTSGTLKRRAPRLAAPACDRSGMWRGERNCPIYGKEPETEELSATGAWSGPLAILVDRRSASATEELASWLKGNDRALIVGERTYGAGCGYVDGGSAIRLHAADLHMMVPNCSRYTRDGVNEIEGIAPDVAIDWMTLAPEKTAAVFERMFERQTQFRPRPAR